ncbi:NAD-dependent epimerase/dehydratase family protein [Planctomycetota bacterium]|nr:NAD-dependent epimerase/dehydratase family protein [Planctomycetota bacterium]
MSDESKNKLSERALIIGCGYLGRVLANHLIRRDLYREVYGVVRSERSGQALVDMGVRAVMANVTQTLSLSALRGVVTDKSVDVFYMIPPGRENAEHTIEAGIGNTMQILSDMSDHVRKTVFVSSTAVYSQRNGEVVTTASKAEPTTKRTAALLTGEEKWLAGGDQYHVLRLAGIYGPKRVIGMHAVMNGSPLIGDINAKLNLIHVSDAAELLIAMMQADSTGRIEIGSDGEPIGRGEYYTALANLVSVSPPQVLDDETAAEQFGLNIERLKRSSSKCLCNKATKERTGWEPRFTNFVEGLRESLIASKR